MNISLTTPHHISSVSFKLYSAKELRQLSVLEVNNVDTFDQIGKPNTGGLHDPRLGELIAD